MLDTPWGDLSQYIVKDGRFEHDYAKTPKPQNPKTPWVSANKELSYCCCKIS
jgi:hypothetical protein